MNVTDVKKIGAGDVAVEIPEDYKEIDMFQAAGQGQDDESGEKRPPHKRQAPQNFDFNSIMKKAMESAH